MVYNFAKKQKINKSPKIRRLDALIRNIPESSLDGSRPMDGKIFEMNGQKFVRLGKNIAPVFYMARDRALVYLAQGGHAPDEIIRQGYGAPPEITIHLVELCLGPLGRLRQAATEPLCRRP
jgi:hypothetical protein